jgi:hypothetical protein
MKINAVTQHAVDRFMTRAKSTKTLRSTDKLWSLAERGVPIGNHRFYAQGWIVVIAKGVARTAYRPRRKEEFQAIYTAMNRLK